MVTKMKACKPNLKAIKKRVTVVKDNVESLPSGSEAVFSRPINDKREKDASSDNEEIKQQVDL